MVLNRLQARAAAWLLGLLAASACGSSGAPSTSGSAGAPAGGASAGTFAVGGAGASAAGAAGAVLAGAPSGGGSSASVDAALTTLVPSVGALIPVFAPNVLSYALRVPNGTGRVAVTPTAAAAGASIRVNGEQVQSGEASSAWPIPTDGSALDLAVLVTAADGIASTMYTLHVSVQAPSSALTIYSVGDSTMADYQLSVYPNQRGWMQIFPEFVTGDATIRNMGINGTSSKSYYRSPGWNSVKAKLNGGDYVFIQFGHNDEKDAGLEGTGGIGTEAWGAYHDYLTRYVNEARALGAIPILFTPVVRLGWNGGAITPVASHDLTGNGTAVGDANYPAAMRDVATQLACPLVDLTTSSKALVEQYGPTDAKALLYISADNTHLQVMGATTYAQLAAEGLSSLGLLNGHLNPKLGLRVSAASLDFGTRYLGSSLDRSFSLIGLSLTPAVGSVQLVAPPGFLVGTDANSASALLELSYTRGALPPTTVSVRFQPASAAVFSSALTCAPGTGASQSVMLDGTALALPAGATQMAARYEFDSVTSVACTKVGGITCADELFSGLYVKDVQPLTTLLPIPVPVPTQRSSILSTPVADSWPAEAAINPQRYLEFSVSAVAGKSLSVDTVSFYAGNGAPTLAFRARCSTHADFSSPTELSDSLSSETNVLTFHSFSPLTGLGPSETFLVRVYPYSTAAATKKYFSLQSVEIHGVMY